MEDVLLFGGTFNPPHLGHIELAQRVSKKLNISKIILIPVGNPPHKNGHNIQCAQHRVNMLQLSVEDKENFEISLIEVNRKGYTYTIDTLRELLKVYNYKCNFYYLIGADTLEKLITWKEFKQVFLLCKFVVILRKGYTKDKVFSIAKTLQLHYKADIIVVDVDCIDVSSTKIREMIRKGECIKNLVYPKVEEYIKDNNLYIESENVYEI